MPVNERGARTNDALEILTRLWTEDDVHFEGKFTTLPGVTLDPKPKQAPMPIWVSGRSEAAMRRCARYGTGWLPYMYTPEKLVESLATIAQYESDYGREGAVKPGLFIFFAVHEDRDVAIEMAAKRLSKQYNQDFSQLVHKYAIAGNPDDCVARLNEYIDAGARTIILNSACPQGYTDENEALMANTVLKILKGS